MKRLILMRHAKSSWKGNLPDIERPLNRRGEGDAPRVAAELVRLGWVPQIVIYSQAVRASQTWQRMAPVFPHVPVTVASQVLYLAGTQIIAATVANLSAETNTALLIGHNPGWEMAVSQLSKQMIRLTTANAALFEIDSDDWSDSFSPLVQQRLIQIIRPKLLL